MYWLRLMMSAFFETVSEYRDAKDKIRAIPGNPRVVMRVDTC